MKKNILISIIIIIGFLTLFLFPSPEENFLAYLSTAISFMILIIIIIFTIKPKK